MDNKITIISAVWCPSCLILNKNLKKLKSEYENINIEYLDYDMDDIEKYHVSDKLPVIICNDKRLVGEKSYDEIINFLKECSLL